MSLFLNKFRFKPLNSFLILIFFFFAISLLFLPLVKIDCPISRQVETNSFMDPDINLSISGTSSNLIDWQLEHEWCLFRYLEINYVVSVSMMNKGTEQIYTSLLIMAELPGQQTKTEQLAENARFIRAKIGGMTEKRIEENITIGLFSRQVYPSTADFPKIEFSIITDPEEILANCPLCEGQGQVDLFTFIRSII